MEKAQPGGRDQAGDRNGDNCIRPRVSWKSWGSWLNSGQRRMKRRQEQVLRTKEEHKALGLPGAGAERSWRGPGRRGDRWAAGGRSRKRQRWLRLLRGPWAAAAGAAALMRETFQCVKTTHWEKAVEGSSLQAQGRQALALRGGQDEVISGVWRGEEEGERLPE